MSSREFPIGTESRIARFRERARNLQRDRIYTAADVADVVRMSQDESMHDALDSLLAAAEKRSVEWHRVVPYTPAKA